MFPAPRTRPGRSRQACLALALFWILPVSGLAAESSADFQRAVEPFLSDHCARCHGEKRQKGDLRLDSLSRDFSNSLVASHWADVMERISSGEMPPEDEPKPDPALASRIVEWFAGQLKEGERARLAKRERVTFHKLTREEYANTIRDLLGVNFDAADPTGLPEDPNWQGFERIGSVMSVSPAHVEKYLAAADAVLNEALPAAPPKKIFKHRDPFDLRYHGQQREKAEKLGLADKARVELWPHDGLDVGADFPASGNYRMRIQLSGMKPPKGRAPHVSIYAKGLDRMLFEQDVVTPEDRPVTIEFTFHVPAGHHDLRLACEAPGPSNLPRHGRFDAGRFFTTIRDSATGRQPWQWKLSDENGVPLRPFLIVDFVDLEGPLPSAGPASLREQYFPPGGDVAQAREILARFTERAFRRPARTNETGRWVQLVEAELGKGEKFDEAMKSAFAAILCAKDFLYLVEGSADRASMDLDGWELASRLSYFLWSTMPDERLFDLARTDALRDRGVLRKEVSRMLTDPRAERFTTGFPKQWLQLKRVGMFPPNKKLYPDYDAHLEKSMITEGTEFFREVLEKNLSLREFLDSDWTMLNARLAEHYGVAGVGQDSFQRIALRPEDHRGGLLTQAGVLSLTSDGLRHRPVHRGKWVLESIFNKPPPPPPANVKPIEPTPATQPKASLRAKLEAHKSDANCAACHRKIDPLGVAFDNYDAIGGWRIEEVVRDGNGANPAVDASGVLPDGRHFADAAALKRLLVADTDRFAAAFIEKLATYALRRALTVDDRRALAALAAQSKLADHRLRDIVEVLVLSDFFQQR